MRIGRTGPPALAVSFAAAAAVLAHRLARAGARPSFVTTSLAVGALSAGIIGGTHPSYERAAIERGIPFGTLAASLHPVGCAPTGVAFTEPTMWVWYESGAPACTVRQQPAASTRLLTDVASLRSGPAWLRRAQVVERVGDAAIVEVSPRRVR